MSAPVEALDPELAALLAADREVDLMPDGVPDRLWTELEARLPEVPKAESSEGDEATGGELPPHGGGGGAVSGGASQWPLTTALSHGLTLALGLAIGAGGTALLSHEATERTNLPFLVAKPAPRVGPGVPAAEPAEEEERDTEGLTEPLPQDAARDVTLRPRLEERHAGAPASSQRGQQTVTGGSRREERAALELARTALGRGDPQEASRALTEHLRRFPRTHYAEEREVLLIRVLSSEGDAAAARQRARRFRDRHPESLFLPALAPLLD